MHLLFPGIIHSAETEPIDGEIFSDNDRVFIARSLAIKVRRISCFADLVLMRWLIGLGGFVVITVISLAGKQ